jgi:hypothetical protein
MWIDARDHAALLPRDAAAAPCTWIMVVVVGMVGRPLGCAQICSAIPSQALPPLSSQLVWQMDVVGRLLNVVVWHAFGIGGSSMSKLSLLHNFPSTMEPSL